MATGKELVRMMTCGIWKEYVQSRKDFCSVQIFDKNGKPIDLKKAENEAFCHVKILFNGINEESLKILAGFLRMVASTRSEFMNENTHSYYGFQEIIIS